MCGIGGIYLPDGVSFTPALRESLEDTWGALTDRGTHASGFSWSWLDSDKTHAWKAPMSSLEALDCDVFKRAGLLVRSMLLHTRYTTQGSTKNNGNNHPVLRDSITLTHNGVIRNDSQVFSHFGVERLHEVDTESVIVALRYGGVEWLCENVGGSFSLAWVDDTVSTQTVNLLTNGRNPLVIGRTVEGAIVWASGLHHLETFTLESHFHALPFKHYTLSPSGVISSKWGSDRREEPQVLTPFSRHAAWGSVEPRTTRKALTPTPTPSKGRKAPSKARKAQPEPSGGWIYDEGRKGWRKMTVRDYYERTNG